MNKKLKSVLCGLLSYFYATTTYFLLALIITYSIKLSIIYSFIGIGMLGGFIGVHYFMSLSLGVKYE